MKGRRVITYFITLLTSIVMVSAMGFASYAADDSSSSAELPLAYSSVTEGYVTPCRKQNPYGTCVLFTSGACAESSLIKNSNGAYSKNNLDLSELQMIYSAFNDQVDPLGNSSGDKNKCNSPLAAAPFVSTTHPHLRLTYANWQAAVPESRMPYDLEWQTKVKNGDINSYDINLGQIAHLQNAFTFPFKAEANRDNAKRMIMKYGAIGALCNVLDEDYSSKYGTYYTAESKGQNHSITVVGWNDNFPREYFCGPDGNHVLPEHDGAWLLKNSHGTDCGTDGDANPENSGMEGYCWMPYEDVSLSSNGYVYDFYPADNYDYNYQYDGTSAVDERVVPAGGQVGATYTVKGLTSSSEKIAAVGLFVNNSSTSGTIRIYTDSRFGDPDSGRLAATVPFATEYNGFHTIEIPDAPVVHKGEDYTVSVEFNKSVSYSIDTVSHSGLMDCDPDFSHDRTFAVDEAGNFTDLATVEQTARVKAYTIDVDDDRYPVIDGTFLIKNHIGTKMVTPEITLENEISEISLQGGSEDENQKFKVIYEEENGTYMIMHCASHKLLTYDVENDKFILRTATEQDIYQRWHVLTEKDGSVSICSAYDAGIVVGLTDEGIINIGLESQYTASISLEEADEYVDPLLVFPYQCELSDGNIVTITLKDGTKEDFVVIADDIKYGPDKFVYLFAADCIGTCRYSSTGSVTWEGSGAEEWCEDFYENKLPDDIKMGIRPYSGPSDNDNVSFLTKSEIERFLTGDLEQYRKGSDEWWISGGSSQHRYYSMDGSEGKSLSTNNLLGCRPAFMIRADLIYSNETSEGKYTIGSTHVVQDVEEETEEPGQDLLKPSTAKTRVYIRSYDAVTENGMEENAKDMGEKFKEAFPDADVRVSTGKRTYAELMAEFDAFFEGSTDDNQNIVILDGHGSPNGYLFVANRSSGIALDAFKKEMDKYKGKVYFLVSGCYVGQWVDGQSHPDFMDALDKAGDKYSFLTDGGDENLYRPFGVGPSASITGKWVDGLTITTDEDNYKHIKGDMNDDGVLTPYELMMYGGTTPYSYEAVIYPLKDDSHFLEVPFKATFNTGNAGTFSDGSNRYVADVDDNVVQKPEDPQPYADGTVFEGWYTSRTGGEEVTFPLELEHNMDIYAHWSNNGEEIGYDKAVENGDIIRIPYKNGSYCDYIILDKDKTNDGEEGMFLVSKDIEGKTTFNKGMNFTYWTTSQAKKWCEEYYDSKFIDEVKDIMPGSTAEIGSTKYEDSLHGERVFFLSNEEAEEYLTAEQRSFKVRWWTRSGEYYQSDGTSRFSMASIGNDEMSARPAINLSIDASDLKYVADKDYFMIRSLINVEAEAFQHIDKTYHVTKNGKEIYTASVERDAACDFMNTLSEVPWTLEVPTAYKNDTAKTFTLSPGKYKGMPYTMDQRDCYDVDNLEEAFKDGLQGLDCSSSTSYSIRTGTGRDILIMDNTAYRTRNFVGDAQNAGSGSIKQVSGNGYVHYDDYVTIVGDYGHYKYGTEINTKKLIAAIKDNAAYARGTIYDHVYAKMKPGDILVRHFITSSNDLSSHTQLVTGVDLVYDGEFIDPDKSRVYFTDTGSPNRTTYRVGGESTAWANENTVASNSMTFTACTESNCVIPVTLNEWKAEESSFTSGDGSQWMNGDKDGLTFTVNVPASNITSVLVDNELVNVSGKSKGDKESEIILSSDYLAALSLGSHSIEVLTESGDISGGFDIVTCNHKNTEIINHKDSTCAEEGYTGDVYCNDCEQISGQGSIIPKKNHVTEVRDAVDATETKEGYTGDTYCTVCGQLVEKGNLTPKAGVKAYNITQGVNSTWIKGSTKNLTFRVDVPKSRINSICLDNAYIGYGYSTGSDYTKITVYAKTLEGLTEGRHLFRVKVADGEALAMFDVLSSDSCSHDNLITTDKKDPTCTEEGYSGDRYCADCGDLIEKGEIVPVSGHVEELRDASQATFEEDGYTGNIYCKTCGILIQKGKVIPKLQYKVTAVNGDTWMKGGSSTMMFRINMPSGDATDAYIDGRGYGYTKHLSDNVGFEFSARTMESLSVGKHVFTCEGKNATVSMEFEVIECHHSDIAVFYEKEASCEKNGYTGDSYCMTCGMLMEKGEIIPALGHDPKLIGSKDATYEEDGYTGDTVCSICGKVLEQGMIIPKLCNDIEAMDGDVWIKGSTKGLTYKVNVGKSDLKAVKLDGVSIGYGYTNTNPIMITVYSSSLKIRDEGSHSISFVTTHGTLETVFTIIPCNHSESKLINAKEATCTEEGYTGDSACISCNEILETGTVIPAKGHDEKLIGAKEATCTEDGYTGDTVCTECGEMIEMGTIIPSIGHVTDITGAKQANCTEDGYTGDTVCSRCNEVISIGSVIPAKGHTPELTGVKEARYDADGYTGDTVCSSCGEILEKGSIIDRLPYTMEPVSGNTWMKGSTTGLSYKVSVAKGEIDYIAVDKTAIGYTYSGTSPLKITIRVATLDGLSMGTHKFIIQTGNGRLETEFEVVPCNHPDTDITGANEATCTEDGYTGDTVCLRCGEVLAQGNAISAKGHDDELRGVKEATCTEDGYTGDTVCSTCDEILAKGSVIPAKGHDTGLRGAKDATYDEDGYTGDTVCARCNEVISEGSVIPALICNHEETVIKDRKDATHLEDGYTGDTVCSICGKTLEKGEMVLAEGHSESVISNGDGTHSTICTVCEEVLGTDSCTDENLDGRCDACDARIIMPDTFRKVTAFTSGNSYLILSGESALKSSLNRAGLHMTEQNGEYIADESIDEGFMWIYDTGKLYSADENTKRYLAADASGHLITTTDKVKAASWNVTDGCLATTVNKKQGNKMKPVTYYLVSGDSSFTISTTRSSINLYEKTGDESHKTYVLRKISMVGPGGSMIMAGDMALQNDLTPVSVSLDQSGAEYTTKTEINENLIWYSEAGKIYSKTGSGNIYLTVDGNNTLITTNSKAGAVNWTVRDGNLYTEIVKRTGNKTRTTKYYLRVINNMFTVNTTAGKVSFFEAVK